jgi:hypothetical protein
MNEALTAAAVASSQVADIGDVQDPMNNIL